MFVMLVLSRTKRGIPEFFGFEFGVALNQVDKEDPLDTIRPLK